jgi:hypothetical protein
MRLIRNPELVRHLRADLRPGRVASLAVVIWLLCGLLALWCWTWTDATVAAARLAYGWLLGAQFVVLGFWSLSACGQAISRERELRTWDFVRTTRLTPADLVIGKLLGAPILAWVTLACTLPISVGAGLLAGFSPGVLVVTYVVLVALLLLLGLIGLCLSMIMDRSSVVVIAGLALLLALGPWLGAPRLVGGWGALNPVTALMALYPLPRWPRLGTPTLLGVPVSVPALTLLLYAAFGAWLALVLVRNLKRDREQMRALSRWQAVGFVAFLNGLFYALLDPAAVASATARDTLVREVDGLVQAGVYLNGLLVLPLAGLALLTPPERLRVWRRRRVAGQAGYLAAEGLPWPWLLLAAGIAYLLLIVAAIALAPPTPDPAGRMARAAPQLAVVALFVIRDVLFLQWCTLTRMRQPVVKGFGWLALHYAAIATVAAVLGAKPGQPGRLLARLTTPVAALTGPLEAMDHGALVVQAAVCGVVLLAIARRLAQPARRPAPAA